MKLLPHLLALVCTCAGMHGHGQGTLIVGHVGDVDPTTEGFRLVSGGNPSLAPVLNDSGRKAWLIGVDTGDIAAYSRFLTPNEQVALEGGWILSLTLRVVAPFEAPTSPTSAISAGLLTGTEAFPPLRIGAQPDGDPIVRIGNSDYALEGAGSGYHNYQMRYEADAGVASLWVDGELLATDIAGEPYPTAQIGWGGYQRPSGSGYANWNEVSLRAIPEPGTTALLAIGGALLLAGQRRRPVTGGRGSFKRGRPRWRSS